MKNWTRLMAVIILAAFSFAILGCGDTPTPQPPPQQQTTEQPTTTAAPAPAPQQVTPAPLEKSKAVEQHITGPGPNGEGIKGHIDKKGVKIYHLPGDPYYSRTTHVAQWFFSEKDAQAAGYRHILK